MTVHEIVCERCASVTLTSRIGWVSVGGQWQRLNYCNQCGTPYRVATEEPSHGERDV